MLRRRSGTARAARRRVRPRHQRPKPPTSTPAVRRPRADGAVSASSPSTPIRARWSTHPGSTVGQTPPSGIIQGDAVSGADDPRTGRPLPQRAGSPSTACSPSTTSPTSTRRSTTSPPGASSRPSSAFDATRRRVAYPLYFRYRQTSWRADPCATDHQKADQCQRSAEPNFFAIDHYGFPEAG